MSTMPAGIHEGLDFDRKKVCAINNAILSMSEVRKAVEMLFRAGGQKSFPFKKWIENGPASTHALYRNLVREEYKELMLAYDQRDPVKFLDNICDLIWVSLGWAIAMEMPVDDAWQEVVRANLNKIHLDGNVVRDENGKIQKPAGWTPPDLAIADMLGRT